VSVNSEVGEGQDRSERTAFPETNGNDTLSRAFGGDPLNDETQTKNHAAGKTDKLPRRQRNVEEVCRGNKMKAAHRQH